MKLRVLGCSGGIGGRHLRTTSLLADDDILIDAGTGAGELELEQLMRIDHVFLTHSHLDHVACLPLIVDTVGDLRNRPLTVYVTVETREILQQHIFNWLIWPDFTVLPTPAQPFMRFQTVKVGESIMLGTRRVTVLPAEHTVPAVGFQLDIGLCIIRICGGFFPLRVKPLGGVFASFGQKACVNFPIVAADEIADFFFALHHH